MIYVTIPVIAGLLVAVVKTNGWTRLFLSLCVLVNVLVIVKVLAINDPYAFRLHPNPGLQPFEHEF